MNGRNPWRGERVLTLPAVEPIVVAASLDHIARVMEATGTDTLEAMNTALHARKPEVLQAALAVMLGNVEASNVMQAVNGVAGLTSVYAAIIGALSGLTPEEEDEAKKQEAGRERQARLLLAQMLGAVGHSSERLSANG